MRSRRQVVAQPGSTTYGGDKLRITKPNAGAFDVAAANATIQESDAAP